MRSRPAVSFAMVMVAGMTQLAGCVGRAAAPSPSASIPGGATASDTARGIVSIVGSEPLTTVLLTAADGRRWRLSGAPLTELRAASGLEVMVRGVVLSPDSGAPPVARFDASQFAVRRADGVEAVDGVLERVSAGFALRLADDRRLVLTAVPVSLRDQIGARIWWSGPLDRAPNAYGLLRGR